MALVGYLQDDVSNLFRVCCRNRDEEHQKGIKRRVMEQYVEDTGLSLQASISDEVYRIAYPSVLWKLAMLSKLFRLGQGGDLQPMLNASIGCQIPTPPAFVMIATRGPFGTGWWAKARAYSNRSSTVSTRRTPACLKRA